MAYYTNLTPYVPTPPGPYPGQGEPSAVYGQANHVATLVGPASGVAVYGAMAPITGSTGLSDYSTRPVTVTETATMPPMVIDPTPVIGYSVYTPLITPLGTRPHFKTPTQVWSWNYGNGGGGSGNGGDWA